MSYMLQTLAEVTGAVVNAAKPEREIEVLCIDSRRISHPGKSLFFALEGQRDGHEYLDEAWQSGIRSFVCRKGHAMPELPESTVLEVEDTLLALQQIAAFHRRQLNYPLIGITGSNGKTMVKEWLAHLLMDRLKLGRSPKSYNSQIGLPLSVWQLHPGLQLGIIEAGISQRGEMEKLATILHPTLGIFTTLGPAHDAGFRDSGEKVREKLRLFESAETLIYPVGYTLLDEEIRRWSAGRSIRLLAWDRSGEKEYGIGVEMKGGQTRLHWGGAKVTIPFTDPASIENACTCLMTLHALGYEVSEFADSFATLPAIDMRLQVVQGQLGCTIINDAYSNDLHSLEIALQFLQKQAGPADRQLVISSLGERSGETETSWQKLTELLTLYEVKTVYAIGRDYFTSRPNLSVECAYFEDTTDFLSKLSPAWFRGKTLLVKGRRDFRFERIVQSLEDRVHETVLEINLNALEQNLRHYRSLVPAGVRIMAMVKAQGYGSGSLEIARQLQVSGADYLAVAYTDEGISLRRNGISLPIMVMNAARESLSGCLDYDLEPVVYDFEVLGFLQETLNSGGIPSATVHVEFDTGMHRLGFRPEDLPDLCARLDRDPRIRVASVFSHLAAADEPQHDEYTHLQIGRFGLLRQEWLLRQGPGALFHTLNTAGIERFPQAAFDMVRPGIGLYGIQASEGKRQDTEPVAVLRARISQITRLEAGETVGYSRAGKMEHGGVMAVVSIGYADGFRRSLGNGRGRVWINGKLAPTLGNICMDMCMVDVSDIECKEGDAVEIFGTRQRIEDLAEAADTIPYEIITGISSRVNRVYYRE